MIRIIRTVTGYEADCPCGWGLESVGHDESSRLHMRTQIVEHTKSHPETGGSRNG